jgi:pimeloyl-ACP methyl ester carboxylesterase
MNGTWEQVDLAGKPADVYLPPGANKPRLGILYLHSLGLMTLRDRPAFTQLFDALGLACVCPHGRRCWWADRICPEFDAALTPERYLLQQVMPCFQARWGLGPGAVGLLGIGMGGQGALRLAFKHAAEFPAVAAIAPAIEYHELYGQGSPLDDMYDSKEQCRQDTAIMHVPPHHPPPHVFFCIDPDDAEWFRGNDRLHSKLTALGVLHETDFTTRAGGHTWDYYNHMAGRAVRFLHAGLEQESRRLL